MTPLSPQTKQREDETEDSKKQADGNATTAKQKKSQAFVGSSSINEVLSRESSSKTLDSLRDPEEEES